MQFLQYYENWVNAKVEDLVLACPLFGEVSDYVKRR
jgi:hypothetical protein